MTIENHQRPSNEPNLRSAYVTMRDGTRIAVEVWLPQGSSNQSRVPTIVWFTRYWRARIEKPSTKPPVRTPLYQKLNQAGYAFSIVDARGSGASFGQRVVEYPDDEILDSGEVIQWLSKQPWSNGRIATDGISYVGNTAELAATTGASILKAAVPRFTDFDFYSQILFPGGLQNIRFLKDWGTFVKALDRNDIATLQSQFDLGFENCLGIRPVEGDDDGRLLALALAEHEGNSYYTDQYENWLFRDDIMGVDETSQVTRRKALYEYRQSLERTGIPMMHWAGWLDSAVADGAIARFATLDAPNLVYIGPWNHGAIYNANPFSSPDLPVNPSADEQIEWILDFLDPLLKEDGDSVVAKRQLHYFTMGEDQWKVATEWPPPGVTKERWYLSADHRLSRNPPSDRAASDSYLVDFEAGTGSLTRWSTSMGGGPVDYGDRAAADARLLTYTSDPLQEDVEITGHAIITLRVSSTHEDGAFIVYLEDVSPESRVTYLTEGILRAIHRKILDTGASYRSFGPYRSFLRADAIPLSNGQVATLCFSLFPTSVLIRKGHRLRVAIAGHDKDNFVRAPSRGRPRIELQRSSKYPSHIDLPIMNPNRNRKNGL